MTYNGLHVVESVLMSGLVRWDTAPKEVREAAELAGLAHIAMVQAQSDLHDAEVNNYVTIDAWKDTASRAVSAGKAMPSKQDVDLAEVTVIARNRENMEATQAYRNAVGALWTLVDVEATREAWLENLRAECAKLAAVMLNDKAGAIASGVTYAQLIALSYWVGEWEYHLQPPQDDAPDLGQTRAALLNMKVWQKPVPMLETGTISG